MMDKKEIEENCPICLMYYKEEDFIGKLNCSHYFHSECILLWLNDLHNNCPICRTKINKK